MEQVTIAPAEGGNGNYTLYHDGDAIARLTPNVVRGEESGVTLSWIDATFTKHTVHFVGALITTPRLAEQCIERIRELQIPSEELSEFEAVWSNAQPALTRYREQEG